MEVAVQHGRQPRRHGCAAGHAQRVGRRQLEQVRRRGLQREPRGCCERETLRVGREMPGRERGGAAVGDARRGEDGRNVGVDVPVAAAEEARLEAGGDDVGELVADAGGRLGVTGTGAAVAAPAVVRVQAEGRLRSERLGAVGPAGVARRPGAAALVGGGVGGPDERGNAEAARPARLEAAEGLPGSIVEHPLDVARDDRVPLQRHGVPHLVPASVVARVRHLRTCSTVRPT